jgi:hypothetical protein
MASCPASTSWDGIGVGVSVEVGVIVGEGDIVIVGVAAGAICGGSVQAKLATIIKSILTSTKRTVGEIDMRRNINDEMVNVNELL